MSAQSINDLLDRLAPELLVCRTPLRSAFAWARRRDVPTLPSFADLFANASPKALLHNVHLRWLLSGANIPCVANHSLNASRSVVSALRYPSSRVVPWDWSRLAVRETTKRAPVDPRRPLAFFAGALSEAKGLGDCLAAAGQLAPRGIRLQLRIAGGGDIAGWQARADALGIADQVEFLGLISHDDVRHGMAEADLVIVPSRHEYAEGLPNTIYEALAARTPLLISDHPAFLGRLKPLEQCMMFRAADPGSLAEAVTRLCEDSALYARLSGAAAAAHDALYVGIEWSALVTLFVGDPLNKTGWVEAHALNKVAGLAGADRQ